MAFAGKVSPVKGTVFLISENSVSIAVSQLKIFFGGMTRGHEQIGFAFVQFLDEESRRVLRQPDGLSFLFVLFGDPMSAAQFAKPFSFFATIQSYFRACEGISYGQRFLRPCDGKGVFRIMSGEDSPKEIRIGVIVQLSGKNMNGPTKSLVVS